METKLQICFEINPLGHDIRTAMNIAMELKRERITKSVWDLLNYTNGIRRKRQKMWNMPP